MDYYGKHYQDRKNQDHYLLCDEGNALTPGKRGNIRAISFQVCHDPRGCEVSKYRAGGPGMIEAYPQAVIDRVREKVRPFGYESIIDEMLNNGEIEVKNDN